MPSQPSSLLHGGEHRALSEAPGELISCGLSIRDEDKYPREAGPSEVSVLHEKSPRLILELVLALILCFGICF